MPARRTRSERWAADGGAGSASGGHISPSENTDPLLESAAHLEDVTPADDTPADETRDARDSTAPLERTEVIPRGSLASDLDLATARARSRQRRRSRPAIRRVKRTLRHIDPVSVLKLSLAFYGSLLVLGLIVAAIAYWFLSAAGVFEHIDRLGRELTIWDDFDISLWTVERWVLLVGVALSLLASVLNVFIAFLYNLAADLAGGAEMTFVERDL
jgi:hypothetical protein